MTEAMDKWVKANDDFEKAQNIVKGMGNVIKQAGDQILRNPFHAEVININQSRGFVFQQGNELFDGNLWPTIEFIDKALTSLKQTREALERARDNEALTPAELKVTHRHELPK